MNAEQNLQGLSPLSVGMNITGSDLTHTDLYFQPFEELYKTCATVAYGLIFVLGFTGNSLLIFTIYSSRSLHTSAYAYLASLACADLLVICSAVPEGIVYTLSSGLWFAGSVVCTVFIFINFFSITVGTLSMAAYTVERYIAVCRPLLAKQVCTLERTGRIIGCCWLAAALYCSPWFAMAQTHSDELSPELVQCQISVPASVYSIVFGTDLLLFYIVPLLIAIFAYWNIGRVMRSLPDRTASGRSQLSASSATSIRRKSASIRCFARRSHSGERLRAGGSGPRSIALISRTSIQSGITAQSTRPLSRRSVSQVRVIQT
ncbi:hypothetical protein RvY_06273-1 [Ramazzottius varieornatus]|uniref:Thyrotropin-releasing hormone receptor n=1 Tax=Ramazzottius varieornatus TaxID=947166 RepID=A0A1D1V3H1_RAMVA|nr:hypothetical protein RvY_06273-1 [Ramazzottius varieornatus]